MRKLDRRNPLSLVLQAVLGASRIFCEKEGEKTAYTCSTVVRSRPSESRSKIDRKSIENLSDRTPLETGTRL